MPAWRAAAAAAAAAVKAGAWSWKYASSRGLVGLRPWRFGSGAAACACSTAAGQQQQQRPFMRGNAIDGKQMAAAIKEEIRAEVVQLRSLHGKVPGLAVVMVGNCKDSQTYVRMKRKACKEVGIRSHDIDLEATVSQREVLQAVEKLNNDPDVHGILVQLPLPEHMQKEEILSAICVNKDVDGFNPVNFGKLAMKGRKPLFVPCTPKACMEILHRCDISIAGKHAVVLGQSNVTGLPISLLLNDADATVTMAHEHTPNIENVVRQADIVVSAVGKAQMVKQEWIKQGAVVIDVGTNAIQDAASKRGYRLVGDIDFDGVKQVASAVTPVPGGVGPMTIAMLLHNTLQSALRTS
eukprot:jgi/Chlat1/2093/Chrsp17S02834